MFPKNQWYAVLEVTEVKAGAVLAARRMGLDLVFWRDEEGTPGAAIDQCPHRQVRLSQGQVEGGMLVCPFHTFRYGRDGICVGLPGMEEEAKKLRLETYELREKGDWLWLWWGTPGASLPPIPTFRTVEMLPSRVIRKDWHTSWERVVEASLDTHHIPVVHAATIGRAASGASVNRGEIEADRIRVDALGSLPGGRTLEIDFRYPNAWTHVVGAATVWSFAAAPVELDRCVVYLRAHQQGLGLPGIGRAAGGLLERFGHLVMEEDRALVENQPPEIDLGATELEGVDTAVAAFRRMHALALEFPDT